MNNQNTDPVTEEDVANTVRNIIENGDIDILTNRLIIEKVRGKFSGRLGALEPGIRELVRKYVHEEVKKQANKDSEPDEPKHAAVKKDPKKVSKTPSRHVQNATVEEHNKEAEAVVKSSRERTKKSLKEPESDDDFADTEKNKSAANNSAEEEDVGDDDFNPEEEEEDKAPIKRRGSRRGRTYDESDSESSEEPVRKAKRRKKAAPASGKMTGTAKEAKELEKIMKVARELNCRVPPSQLKGITSYAEKTKVIITHLGKKGFDATVPANLKQNNIKEFKRKLANEKELKDLDTNNIINNGDGRLRARRSATVSYVYNNEEEDELDEGEIPPPPSSSAEAEDESEGYIGEEASDEDD